MPAPVRIVHDTDPRYDITADVTRTLKGVQVPPYSVLLAMYERDPKKGGREAKTAGGIIIPQAQKTGTLREDTYQGKVGLVIKLGKLAFTDDDTHKWDGFRPAVGDWVAISVGDTYSFDIPAGNGESRRCRLVEDGSVKMIVPDDAFDAIW